MTRSKLYRKRCETVERRQLYALEQAIRILKEAPAAKFDETVELAMRLGVDPKQSDQVVRGAMVLPNGTGKDVRVVVIASGEEAEKASAAGATEVGSDELLERIKGGWLDFDVLIATPAAMKQVRTLGRILGPRGLMPNPKTGTVSDNPEQAVTEAKAGRVEYRADRAGCVHVPVGKLSFTPEALESNINAVIQAVQQARPATAKGVYFRAAAISSTMSPGIRIDIRNMVKA